MNVLFLDFDGPLFTDRMIAFHPDNQKNPYTPSAKFAEGSHRTQFRYWKMDEISVRILNMLHDIHPFKTVVSSTWKEWCTKELVEELFQINGLTLDLHDDWATPRITSRSCRRMDEIDTWMKEHPEVSNCVVIDDRSSGVSINEIYNIRKSRAYSDLYPRVPNDRIFIVHEDAGLTRFEYYRLKDIMRIWNGEGAEVKKEKEHREALFRSLTY